MMTLRVDARPAGRREDQLLLALNRADAFICILTQNGVNSSWVVGQTGTAISCEYTKHMMVLPVCPQNKIPNFVAAFRCFFLKGEGEQAIEDLAKELDEAIAAHQARRPPRNLHQSPPQGQEGGEQAHRSDRERLSCQCRPTYTSVPGYKLQVGAQSAESLQTDLNGTEIVMGLIGRDTANSDYVLFELGASWGLRKPSYPSS